MAAGEANGLWSRSGDVPPPSVLKCPSGGVRGEALGGETPPLRRYFTSSGSAPLGLPVASRAIFSTRASACRSRCSQRRLRTSPRS
jgi:hypothetical protein